MNDDVVGRPTSWRITALDDPDRWTVTSGVEVETSSEDGDLVIHTVVGSHDYIVSPR
jgi:hypothetical protein